MSKEVKHIHKVGDNTFLFETYEQPLRTQIEELKQQLAEKDNTITNLIEDSKASKELLKKQLAEQPKQIVDKIKSIGSCDTDSEWWWDKEKKAYVEGEQYYVYTIKESDLDTILKEMSDETAE